MKNYKKYKATITSQFDNHSEVFNVHGEDEYEALANALIEYAIKNEVEPEHVLDVHNSVWFPKTYTELQDMLAEADLWGSAEEIQ